MPHDFFNVDEVFDMIQLRADKIRQGNQVSGLRPLEDTGPGPGLIGAVKRWKPAPLGNKSIGLPRLKDIGGL